MNLKIFACVNLTLAMIIVGSSVVFGKIITCSFPVFLASGLRFAVASLIMLPIMLNNKEKLSDVSGKDKLRLLFMAFCGQFVFTVLVLIGLRYTSAIEAGIITSTSPAMMVVVTFLLLREKPGFMQVFAVLLVLVGIIFVNGFFDPKIISIGFGHLLGNLLMIGAVLGEAFFLLMRKRISVDISNISLTGYLCFLGFFMFLPLSVYQGFSFDFSGVSSIAWIAILYFGAIFTVVAYLFWFKGVSRVSGSTASVFTAVMPVAAVALSCLFLKEQLTLSHAFGGLLIVIAILLIARAPDCNTASWNGHGEKNDL